MLRVKVPMLCAKETLRCWSKHLMLLTEHRYYPWKQYKFHFIRYWNPSYPCIRPKWNGFGIKSLVGSNACSSALNFQIPVCAYKLIFSTHSELDDVSRSVNVISLHSTISDRYVCSTFSSQLNPKYRNRERIRSIELHEIRPTTSFPFISAVRARA